MKFRTGYDGLNSEASACSGLMCEDPSLTVQSEKDNCDINVIVRRFGVTSVAQVDARPVMQGDFSNVGDFRSALESVMRARESFDALPAMVRARFGNDPQQFLEFCSNSSNQEEARKLGLCIPQAPPPEPPKAA